MQYRLHIYSAMLWDVYWFEKNIQGDVVAIYNSQGTKLISYVYTAYGICGTNYHNGGLNTTAIKNRLTYRGYYFDIDLQMYYLNSRYYNQNTCRFISPDDVSYLGANGDLISYNLYAYCSNNPVNFVDPSGHSAVSYILVGFMIAVPFVFAISSIISDLEQTNGEPNIVGSPHDKSDGINGESFSPYAQYETYEMFGLLYGASFEAGLYTQIFDINESLQANFDLVKADLAVTAFGGGSGVYLAELSLSQSNINILGQNITVSLKGNVGLGAKAQIGKRGVFGFSNGVGFELSVYIN